MSDQSEGLPEVGIPLDDLCKQKVRLRIELRNAEAYVTDLKAQIVRLARHDCVLMTALEKAIEVVGSQVELARFLNVTKAAVNQWKLPGRKVPVIHCSVIERETKGAVRCEDLRPDINWSFMRHDERQKESGAIPHATHTRAANGDAFGTPLKRRAEDKIDEKESA